MMVTVLVSGSLPQCPQFKTDLPLQAPFILRAATAKASGEKVFCKCLWEALTTVKGKERGKLRHQHPPWLQCQVHPPWIHPETVTHWQKHLLGNCCINSTLQPLWAVQPLGEHNEGSSTVGNLQGDPSSHCFGKRPRRQSTDLSSSRHLRAKCRLITTSSAHPPRASPGDHVFEAPKYLLLICFRGFPSPHHRQCKSPTQSHPR